MIFLGKLELYQGDTNTYRVGYINMNALDPETGEGKTEEELELEGVLIGDLKAPEPVPDRIPVLYVKKDTKETFYQYEIIPPKPVEKTPLEKIIDDNLIIMEALADLFVLVANTSVPPTTETTTEEVTE